MIEKLKIAELTSGEAKEWLTEDAVILLPLGSTEDQGTHAPMGDYLAAEHVALDICRAARDNGIPTFMAPVIPYGGRDFFISSHGGLSLQPATLVAVLTDMIESLTRHGLKKILFVNGHGGNVEPINEVALNLRLEKDIFVASMYLWQIAYKLLIKERGEEEAAKSSGHGADPLTSVGLHYFPELARPDLMGSPKTGLTLNGMSVTGYGEITYQDVEFQVPVTAAETAPEGVWGADPKYCNAETGKMLASRLASIGAGFIRDHVA